jgi:outer membrane protein insertion porin family
MGTGNRVALELGIGEFQKVYQAEYTEAYRTIDGLTRSLSLSYQDLTQFTSVSSDFSTTTASAGVSWDYPFADLWRVRYGVSYQDAELLTSIFSSSQASDWVRQNGDPFAFGSALGTKVTSLELVTAVIYDSRNATLFPTAGSRFAFRLNTAVPGSNIEYYMLGIDFAKYFDLPGRWLFYINHETGYGDGYGDTEVIPPFHNQYAGGPGSVRGFRESTLGPLDSLGNPYGGNFLFTNQFELIIPTPAKIGNSVRLALFFDVGGVFSTDGTVFRDRLGDIMDLDFDYDRLKKSAGIAVEWLAPLGLLRLSYALPFNEDEETDRFFADDVEQFQFSIGNAF